MFVDLSAAISIKAYKAVDAKVALAAGFWNERVELWTDYRYRGLSRGRLLRPRRSRTRDARVPATASRAPTSGRTARQARAAGCASAPTSATCNPTIGHGRDEKLPVDRRDLHRHRRPGLANAARLPPHDVVRAKSTTAISAAIRRSGGFYRASFGIWERRDARAVRPPPLRRRSVAVLPARGPQARRRPARIGLSYVNNETGQRVPFYFLPYVGGADTLRSFREFRFRDENVLFLNARVPLGRRSSSRRRAVRRRRQGARRLGRHRPGDLKTSYGIGFRVAPTTRVRPLRHRHRRRRGHARFFKFGPSF